MALAHRTAEAIAAEAGAGKPPTHAAPTKTGAESTEAAQPA